ncbi:MAG: Tm-1-like ATP-binding domain-containing protein, partial [Treponema sp.]|nr:Tm-1-like ATP-binding domain-containing protein [Treponema sp.]
MGKTIALIASLDTKSAEILFARELIEKRRMKAFVIDISAKNPRPDLADLASPEILKIRNIQWEDFDAKDRAARIELLSESLAEVIPAYYRKGCFDGILSIGGGQNARMAAGAMKNLPYGVPKVIVSPLISGKRELEQYVFDRDVMVMHSVADFSGLNSMTRMVIGNVVNAAVGMTERFTPFRKTPDKKTVGVSLLGITSRGAVSAMEVLEARGLETMGFHANGTGGRCFENLIHDGVIDAALDMNLHELTCEQFGGYCSGANNRLTGAGEKGIPLVFAPGGVDVIDYYVAEHIPARFDERQKIYHNAHVCHTKIFPEEAEKLGRVVAERLSASKGPKAVVLPQKGFCEAGAPGGKLYNPETDGIFMESLRKNLNPRIPVKTVDA